MKNILFATDFSPCSENAQEMAVELSRKYGASLHIFHSVQAPVDWVKLTFEQEENYPEVKSRINKAKIKLEELSQSYDDLDIHTHLGFNAADEDIIQHAQDNQVDLIVMGSHGEGGFSDLILGSNARRVVEVSPIPVLVSKKVEREVTV